MCSRPIIYIDLCGSGERGPQYQGTTRWCRCKLLLFYYYYQGSSQDFSVPCARVYIDHDTVQRRRSLQLHKDIATSDAAECFRAEHMYIHICCSFFHRSAYNVQSWCSRKCSERCRRLHLHGGEPEKVALHLFVCWCGSAFIAGSGSD